MKSLTTQLSLSVDVTDEHGIVIPMEFLESLGIPAGQQYRVIPIGRRLELVPILPPGEAKGFLKGIDTSVDDDDLPR